MALLAGALLLFALTPTDGSFLVHVLPASLLAALGMSLAYIPAMIAATTGALGGDGPRLGAGQHDLPSRLRASAFILPAHSGRPPSPARRRGERRR